MPNDMSTADSINFVDNLDDSGDVAGHDRVGAQLDLLELRQHFKELTELVLSGDATAEELWESVGKMASAHPDCNLTDLELQKKHAQHVEATKLLEGWAQSMGLEVMTGEHAETDPMGGLLARKQTDGGGSPNTVSSTVTNRHINGETTEDCNVRRGELRKLLLGNVGENLGGDDEDLALLQEPKVIEILLQLREQAWSAATASEALVRLGVKHEELEQEVKGHQEQKREMAEQLQRQLEQRVDVDALHRLPQAALELRKREQALELREGQLLRGGGVENGGGSGGSGGISNGGTSKRRPSAISEPGAELEYLDALEQDLHQREMELEGQQEELRKEDGALRQTNTLLENERQELEQKQHEQQQRGLELDEREEMMRRRAMEVEKRSEEGGGGHAEGIEGLQDQERELERREVDLQEREEIQQRREEEQEKREEEQNRREEEQEKREEELQAQDEEMEEREAQLEEAQVQAHGQREADLAQQVKDLQRQVEELAYSGGEIPTRDRSLSAAEATEELSPPSWKSERAARQTPSRGSIFAAPVSFRAVDTGTGVAGVRNGQRDSGAHPSPVGSQRKLGVYQEGVTGGGGRGTGAPARKNFGSAMPKDIIAKAAMNDASITGISFNNNASIQMKSYGYAVLLMEALQTNTHVTEVSLVKCGITDVDAAVLAGVLAVNKTIVQLDLDGNKIKGDGAIAIAKVIALTHSLIALTHSLIALTHSLIALTHSLIALTHPLTTLYCILHHARIAPIGPRVQHHA
jgi:hypothetical protein